jgi:hypothetical protein
MTETADIVQRQTPLFVCLMVVLYWVQAATIALFFFLPRARGFYLAATIIGFGLLFFGDSTPKPLWGNAFAYIHNILSWIILGLVYFTPLRLAYRGSTSAPEVSTGVTAEHPARTPVGETKWWKRPLAVRLIGILWLLLGVFAILVAVVMTSGARPAGKLAVLPILIPYLCEVGLLYTVAPNSMRQSAGHPFDLNTWGTVVLIILGLEGTIAAFQLHVFG